jgi:alpha-tubulin suppressor-like RCC1 family protein
MRCIPCRPIPRPARRWRVRRLNQPLALLLPVGLVAALGCSEDAASPTGPESEVALATTASTALAFSQVSAGNAHTCGVTTDNRAYCWGNNARGQLGDGSTTDRLTPAAVATTRRFRQLSAGDHYTCGVTLNYQAYCWGHNGAGELGDGTTALPTLRLKPVRVAGGHYFRQVDAGGFHTCAVSYPDNHVYCWGYNQDGELGDGTSTNRSTPVAVSSRREFRQVRAGGRHTCGVTTGDKAFCWGENLYGQLGDGTAGSSHPIPTPVVGIFRQVDLGQSHTCGVTIQDRVFCWGYGGNGQMGDGTTTGSYSPKPIASGLSFERVSAGYYHNCAETTLNRVYCWGNNDGGQLGDGTTTTRVKPVPVGGGRFFAQVSGGSFHTCGKTPASVAYCWGENSDGELGDGTTTDRRTPVAVVSP